ncbi:DMT family transporter [Salipiger sp. 1_MG-2023]|uniref:DMT family transporter n=1 Tax=Salipiger sp. 1_MG-2023 TaxID=3062665 RepID=UPI0026E1974C|nr:DMT family transporter [Salipiger sp. 1_MG-2023]MDO6587079.1 DMT family transporter [Salipiger sp. 1_MG-2023]
MPIHPTAAAAVPHDPARKAPENLKGIVLITLGFICFGATDALAKLLTSELPPLQVVWMRQTGLFLGVLVMIAIRGTHLLRTRHPVVQIGRGVLATGSAAFFIIAISNVPLADATAVTFIAPFLVTAAGALFLREPVGVRRWAAVAVGFVGMVIVIRPGAGVFHPAIFIVIAAATCFAMRQVLSRVLSGEDSIATTVAYTSITSTLLLTLPVPFIWETPAHGWVWMVVPAMALAAGAGEIFIIRALDVAQAVVVAPLQYSMIIWSTLYGFLLFADLPDGFTLLGCAVIVASGLYTLNRERIVARQQRRQAQAEARNEAEAAARMEEL